MRFYGLLACRKSDPHSLFVLKLQLSDPRIPVLDLKLELFDLLGQLEKTKSGSQKHVFSFSLIDGTDSKHVAVLTSEFGVAPLLVPFEEAGMLLSLSAANVLFASLRSNVALTGLFLGEAGVGVAAAAGAGVVAAGVGVETGADTGAAAGAGADAGAGAGAGAEAVLVADGGAAAEGTLPPLSTFPFSRSTRFLGARFPLKNS